MRLREAWQALNSKAIVVPQPQTQADLIALPDVVMQQVQNEGLLKSPSPTYLIRPPFGVPIPKNIPAIRQFGRNAYVFSAIQTISDEVANTEWEIVQDEDANVSDEALQAAHKFFENPNGNDETFAQILRKTTPDILEIDAGVWVKAFNFEAFVPQTGRNPGKLTGGKMVQFFAKDGGGFRVNPDIYGYFGNRAEFIAPVLASPGITQSAALAIHQSQNGRLLSRTGELLSLGQFGEQFPQLQQLYSATFLDQAAYFQYPNRNAQLPIPFGRREIVYMMRNPRTDSHYGRGAVEMMTDIVSTLIYGSKYNLDMYINSNMPEGALQLLGAHDGDIQRFRKQITKETRRRDVFGNLRRVFFKFPIINVEAKWIPFSWTPREMEIIAQQSWFIKLLWATLGVNASEMGFTEDSNRATEHVQSQVVKRKVINPILMLYQGYINMKLMPEFGAPGIKFKFKDNDLQEDHSKIDLAAKMVSIGILSRRSVAEERKIDFDKELEQMEEDGDAGATALPSTSQSLPDGEGEMAEGGAGEESPGSSHLEESKAGPALWPKEPYYHGKVRTPHPGRKAAAAKQPVNISQSDDLGILIPFFRELDKKLEQFFENIPEEGDDGKLPK